MQPWIQDHVISIGEPEPMEFHLTYEGRVPSSGHDETLRAKHDIRKTLHVQLAELWRNTPELQHLSKRASYLEVLASDFACGEFKFAPLVTGRLRLVCHLDILFFRRELSDALITKPKDEYGGDLDNRLKVFFDALRVPSSLSELPNNVGLESHEQPYFYCLVEDDSLITKFQVESTRLLERPSLKESITEKDIKKHVRLVVRVTIKPSVLTWENLSLQGV